MVKDKRFREVEEHFEIDLYKLIGIITVMVLLCVGLGSFLGYKLGHAEGKNSVDIEIPDYCHIEITDGQKTVVCGTELEDSTVDELCNALSTSLRRNLRVLLIS